MRPNVHALVVQHEHRAEGVAHRVESFAVAVADVLVAHAVRVFVLNAYDRGLLGRCFLFEMLVRVLPFGLWS